MITLAERFRVKSPPWVKPVEVDYSNPEKLVIRQYNRCWEAEAIKKITDKELQLFFAENWCVHDKAWVEGFNPEVMFEQSKHFLRGDDCCEFVIKLPKNS